MTWEQAFWFADHYARAFEGRNRVFKDPLIGWTWGTAWQAAPPSSL